MKNNPESLSAKDLPKPNASLKTIIRFSRKNDPLLVFIEKWGDKYKERTEALWNQCVAAYKNQDMMNKSVEELLFCLSYDIALGPYLGVPDPHKLPFLRWLIENIRSTIDGPTR